MDAPLTVPGDEAAQRLQRCATLLLNVFGDFPLTQQVASSVRDPNLIRMLFMFGGQKLDTVYQELRRLEENDELHAHVQQSANKIRAAAQRIADDKELENSLLTLVRYFLQAREDFAGQGCPIPFGLFSPATAQLPK